MVEVQNLIGAAAEAISYDELSVKIRRIEGYDKLCKKTITQVGSTNAPFLL